MLKQKNRVTHQKIMFSCKYIFICINVKTLNYMTLLVLNQKYMILISCKQTFFYYFVNIRQTNAFKCRL